MSLLAALVAVGSSAFAARSAPGPVIAHRETIRATASPARARLAGTDELAPCRDSAHHLNGGRWSSPLRWSFRAMSTPSGLARSAVEAALRRAVSHIVTGRNDCGLVDKIDAKATYLGRTKRATGVSDDSECGSTDGHNVVGFGQLRPIDMAVTCWWTQDGVTIEADVKLNKANFRWVPAPRSTCRLAWSVEAVATHEFGHAFGLDHVGETVHGNLTMSPLIAPCQNGEATLGLGDVKGLRSLY